MLKRVYQHIKPNAFAVAEFADAAEAVSSKATRDLLAKKAAEMADHIRETARRAHADHENGARNWPAEALEELDDDAQHATEHAERAQHPREGRTPLTQIAAEEEYVYLIDAVTDIKDAEAILKHVLKGHRDRLIRGARAKGATIASLAEVTELSPSQINNILGNRSV